MLQMTCMCTSERTIIVLILVTDVHMYMQWLLDNVQSDKLMVSADQRSTVLYVSTAYTHGMVTPTYSLWG